MNLKIFLGIGLLMSLPFLSCQDEWNDHYDRSDTLPEANLLDLIRQDSNLTTFANVLKTSGYDTVLAMSQTFTVWAPVNKELAALDYADTAMAKLIAGNHISRFNYASSTSDDLKIRMINRKKYGFSSDGETLSFGGCNVLSKDALAQNGLLHTISDTIPFYYNIYEYLGANKNVTDSVSDFLKTFDEFKFDKDMSIVIGNVGGKPKYDSVFNNFNVVLRDPVYGLGNINSEDSVYTMLVPTNEAWSKAYNRIAPYFKVYNADKEYADSVQRVQTQQAIFNDLIYRKPIGDPSTLDTLLTSSSSVIRDVPGLFEGATKVNTSNGIVYLTDSIRYKNWETWQKEIVVEAEVLKGRKVGNEKTTATTKTVTTSVGFSVSKNQYVLVDGSGSVNASIVYDIPNVLAGKYDIYVVLLPATVDGATNSNNKTRLEFSLDCMQSDGKNPLASDTKNKSTPVSYSSDDMLTSSTEVVKMKVASGVSFPVSNYYDRAWLADEKHTSNDVVTYTKLTIMTKVASSETATYEYAFRLDKIIFEPVHE